MASALFESPPKLLSRRRGKIGAILQTPLNSDFLTSGNAFAVGGREPNANSVSSHQLQSLTVSY